ncbi:hypothetical protein NUACC21_48980 [Scytonema sp. NUACC21]
MLYLALPPIPPPIVITLPPERVAEQPSAEKIPAITKLTKPSIQDSGVTRAATAQPLVCTSLQPQTSERIDNLIRKISAKSEETTVNCTSQKKKSAILNLQANLRKQKPAVGFSPVAIAPTSNKNNLPAAESSTLEDQASVSTPLNTPSPANTTNSNSGQQSDNQKLTNALNQVSQKNTLETILAAVQELINLSLPVSLKNSPGDTAKTDTQNSQQIASSASEPTSTPQVSSSEESTSNAADSSNTENGAISGGIELARRPGEAFLVGVVVDGREIGTLDILQEDKTLLIPLERFAEIAGFTVETAESTLQLKTPLGVVTLQPDSLKQINGVTYITNTELEKELKISLELNTADLTLLTTLPWRGTNRQYQASATDLKPDFLPPSNLISNFRQDLNIYHSDGDTTFRSASTLGGRFLGFAYRLRMENNFEDNPDINEYYIYKRSGQFRYQLGRQQIGLHPLLNGLDLTGFQLGYSNLSPETFDSSYSANEILPRRSRPLQTFRGQAPAASFVQLRVGGIVVAQQQVGFNGQYEFLDVNLPVSQSSEVEIVIFDRNNLRVPLEIRSARINASDLLLPAGGNVQLAGLGISGNLAQNIFGDSTSSNDNELVGFYQLRQGLSNNLTFEGSVQAVPDSLQTQAGLIWRLANPVILSASVGSSQGQIGYSADLDVQLNRLDITANSQSFPEGYTNKNTTERYNHSLEAKYRFGNYLSLGFIARSRKDGSNDSTDYILPTFYARPLSNVSLNGRPDIDGRYLLNAFYQPNRLTRLSFSSYGDAYISDLSYDFSNNYRMSFGTEFGGDLAPRYSVSIGHQPSSLSKLSWNLGLAYSDGEVGPLVGASMRVLPGLLARVDYQGIPSRSKGYGGFGDDRLTVSLVSDLSFLGGRIAPADSIGIGKERGGIAGRLVIEGENQGFDLGDSIVRVYDKRNKEVGVAKTDSKGNFFVGNLPEGTYVVQLEPEELPVELSVMKTSAVAEVATSAVTSLDFPVRPEFGVAGRITDLANQPIGKVRVELINGAGARVMSGVTDEFGLYRLDGVPVGVYTLRVSPQDSLNPNDTLPKREINIRNQFVYDQDLQLPVSSAVKKNQ